MADTFKLPEDKLREMKLSLEINNSYTAQEWEKLINAQFDTERNRIAAAQYTPLAKKAAVQASSLNDAALSKAIMTGSQTYSELNKAFTAGKTLLKEVQDEEAKLSLNKQVPNQPFPSPAKSGEEKLQELEKSVREQWDKLNIDKERKAEIWEKVKDSKFDFLRLFQNPILVLIAAIFMGKKIHYEPQGSQELFNNAFKEFNAERRKQGKEEIEVDENGKLKFKPMAAATQPTPPDAAASIVPLQPVPPQGPLSSPMVAAGVAGAQALAAPAGAQQGVDPNAPQQQGPNLRLL